MHPCDLQAALREISLLQIGENTTEAEAAASMRAIAAFGDCTLGLVRFSGQTPWERHPHDELLYPLEGEVEVTLLGDSGARCEHVRAGSLFVVPRGEWHRQHARVPVALLFATSSQGNEDSTAADPRQGSP